MMDDGTPQGTEPQTLEEMAETLVEPEAENEDADETTDAPDTEEDQTEVEEDADDGDDGEDPEPLEDDDDEEDEAEDQEPLFTVKVNGKDEQVTLGELQRGYSGQQHIQRGMQEVAESRKALEADQQAIAQQRQQLDYLIQAQQAGAFVPPTPPDMAMLQNDPIGYMEAKATYDQQAAEYQNAVYQYQEQQHFAQQQQAQQHQAYLHEQSRLLKEAVPEFADETKAPALIQKITSVAMNEYGFSQEELQALADSRYGRALYDLVQYQELKARQGKAVAKAKKAPPIAKAGAKTDQTRSKSRKNRERLRASGSDADAMAMMLND